MILKIYMMDRRSEWSRKLMNYLISVCVREIERDEEHRENERERGMSWWRHTTIDVLSVTTYKLWRGVRSIESDGHSSYLGFWTLHLCVSGMADMRRETSVSHRTEPDHDPLSPFRRDYSHVSNQPRASDYSCESPVHGNEWCQTGEVLACTCMCSHSSWFDRIAYWGK